MARVNITIPDELLARTREAGLNVSRVAAMALAEEVDRRAKIDELDDYLRELDGALGQIEADEEASAREWAARALGGVTPDGGAPASRAS
jgi:hypothetical protein